jgi:hypothetical protein
MRLVPLKSQTRNNSNQAFLFFDDDDDDTRRAQQTTDSNREIGIGISRLVLDLDLNFEPAYLILTV